MDNEGGTRLEGQEATRDRVESHVGRLGRCSQRTQGKEPSERFGMERSD